MIKFFFKFKQTEKKSSDNKRQRKEKKIVKKYRGNNSPNLIT